MKANGYGKDEPDMRLDLNFYTGKAYDAHTPTEADRKGCTVVFHIPEKARELNANLVQNPGY